MFQKLIVFSIFLSLMVIGCDDDESTAPSLSNNTLVLSLTGVQTLQNGYHYEGWAIVDGAAVTTGKVSTAFSLSLLNQLMKNF